MESVAFFGEIDHVRCETGLIDDRAREYLAGAIKQRQVSKSLPVLGEIPAETVLGFNYAFRRSYVEIAEENLAP